MRLSRIKVFQVFMIIALVISMFGIKDVTKVSANSVEPEYIDAGDGKFFYFANGNPIQIVDGPTGNEWNPIIICKGIRKQVSYKTIVYGGGKEGTNFTSSSIEMNGKEAAVNSIVGGGISTNVDKPANVDNVKITINGGYIDNTIIGGGYGAATVMNVDIKINGGLVGFYNKGVPYYGSICGGGVSSGKMYDFSTNSMKDINFGKGAQDPTLVPNRVENADITLNNGKVLDAVFGGGQGYSYVKNAVINIPSTSKVGINNYVIAGGSNGRTDNGTINFGGGVLIEKKVLKVHHINRGSMINSTINVTGGEITNLYVGAEDKQSIDTNLHNPGILGKATVNITGGLVNNLNLGYSYQDKLPLDKVLVNYNQKYLNAGILPQVKKDFGSSAIDTFDNEIKNVVLNKQALTVNKGENTTLTATIKAGADATELDKNITWTTSKPEVATVVNGKITAVAKGETTITATAGNKSANCVISVYEKVVNTDSPKIETPKDSPIKVELPKETTSTMNDSINEVLADLISTTVVDDKTRDNITKALAKGENISSKVVASVVEREKIIEDAKKIESTLKENEVIGAYLNLDVILTANGKDIGSMSKLSAPITFTISIPKELIKEGRTYYIVTIHNGVTKKIPAVVKDGKLTFTTQEFSIYAIAYEMKKEEMKPIETPNTADTTSPVLWISVLLSTLGFGVLSIKKFKEN